MTKRMKIYAFRMWDHYHLAHKAPAGTFGKPTCDALGLDPDAPVWVDPKTSGFLGAVGDPLITQVTFLGEIPVKAAKD